MGNQHHNQKQNYSCQKHELRENQLPILHVINSPDYAFKVRYLTATSVKMRKSADEFLKKYALLPERFFFSNFRSYNARLFLLFLNFATETVSMIA